MHSVATPTMSAPAARLIAPPPFSPRAQYRLEFEPAPDAEGIASLAWFMANSSGHQPRLSEFNGAVWSVTANWTCAEALDIRRSATYLHRLRIQTERAEKAERSLALVNERIAKMCIEATDAVLAWLQCDESDGGHDAFAEAVNRYGARVSVSDYEIQAENVLLDALHAPGGIRGTLADFPQDFELLNWKRIGRELWEGDQS